MAKYQIKDAAGNVIAERSTQAAALAFIKADLAYRGNWGPYTIDGSGYVYVAGFELSRVAIKNVGVITPRTDTNIPDPRYPTGTPPVSTPVIFVASPPALTGTAAVSFSQNLSSYVTGADATGYVMSLVPTSGTLGALGLSLASTTVSGTAVAGSFSYRLRVTKGGYQFDAPDISQIVINAATANFFTTVPAMLTVAYDSTAPQATVEFDQPMNLPSASSNLGDRVSTEIWKQVNAGAPALLTTKTASLAQVVPVMTLTAIGGATLGSVSTNGADFSINGIVDGDISNTADKCNFYGGPITLPVGGRVLVTIPAYTASSGYEIIGPMIRQGLTPLAPMLSLWRRPDATGLGTPMISRATQGSGLTYTSDAQITGEAQVVIERLAANQWRFDVYTNGTIAPITTHAVTMTGPVYVGYYASASGTGPGFSAPAKNFAVNVQGRTQHVDNAVPSGSSYSYFVKGKYAASPLNISANSPTVTGTIVPIVGAAIKFHPGHYAWYAPSRWFRVDEAAPLADILAFIDGLANEPAVKGIHLATLWGAAEGDTAGSYKFASFDAILARCQLRGKRLLLQIAAGWAGNIDSNYTIFPKYIVDQFGIINSTQVEKPTRTVGLWLVPQMDRYIALIEAFGARYNNHPYMEMISFPETAIGGISTNGFSNQAYLTQIQRLIAATRAAWPNTGLRVSANDLAPDPLMTSLFETCKTYACAIGGPDVWPATITQADRQYAGYNASRQLVYEVLIDKLPWAVEIQSPELSRQPQTGFPTGFTCQQLYNAALNGYTATQGGDAGFVQPAYKVKYLIWYVNTWAGDSTTQWQNGELPVIRANPNTNSQIPTLYPGVIT